MTEETSAGIVVFFAEHGKREYLLLKYTEGHVDFPKGHVEGKETIEETARRETMEETGLDVDIMPGFMEKLDYSFKYGGKPVHKSVYFFTGEAKGKNVLLSDEHESFLWLSYEDALKRLTYANAKRILKRTEEFLKAKK